jgi:flagella basal body P-ring formation protein FlgA
LTVKRASIVQVVAKRKNLTVTIANGELQTDAKVGEIVRVLNPQSKRVVSGLLVTPTTVEIQL